MFETKLLQQEREHRVLTWSRNKEVPIDLYHDRTVLLHSGSIYFFCAIIPRIWTMSLINEPRREKTAFLPIRKQSW